MERSTFLKSLAGVGVGTLGLNSLSSCKTGVSVSSVDPDVMPAHISGAALDFNKMSGFIHHHVHVGIAIRIL